MTAVDAHRSEPTSGPRSPEQRKREAFERLGRDKDVWVATADAGGEPCLVPLAFWWDGEAVWLATRDTNPTGRNLCASGRVRLSFGHTRDVVLAHGTASVLTREELPVEVGDAFAAKDGWDPREDHPSYVFFRVTLRVVQAWGTVPEMAGRTLMRDGKWLV
ncbi:pyridoxamine 5'-phosphate oxidase family protein [Streptomyces griseiscabiei]|uniref:Pyridoxamine 5'-phosphate oxidase family protein n=1 Tax=Streptomyces griseiscabiei TaxID=2993540 RepID=A0ABU4KWZ3_9ACTN|nr:pyridoxamine 5'-phosphate oxidase family protein [Streptomyces griseiscabiei]MBZ3900503.1 pyridoxamine 5'-phosphate oxidase family protein [Streptomyces griseiscabiei]MDX2907818.1 pyridoxamine 5'-phosphate oxidase family protein [Streptomyces griseiscabiei]